MVGRRQFIGPPGPGGQTLDQVAGACVQLQRDQVVRGGRPAGFRAKRTPRATCSGGGSVVRAAGGGARAG
jgi:hypothetical protein